jgi:serine/threonine protein kinase
MIACNLVHLSQFSLTTRHAPTSLPCSPHITSAVFNSKQPTRLPSHQQHNPPQPSRYETTNHLWLILEYCVGGDLMTLLKTDIKLPESSVHDFARDLVIAMQYLHHHSIIYCDLKPSNILLDENGRLKLGGFGLSRRLADINKASFAALPPVSVAAAAACRQRRHYDVSDAMNAAAWASQAV